FRQSQQLPDLVKRHVDAPEHGDETGDFDLRVAVLPIAVARIDRIGREKTVPVVEPERLRRQPCGRRELSNCHQIGHAPPQESSLAKDQRAQTVLNSRSVTHLEGSGSSSGSVRKCSAWPVHSPPLSSSRTSRRCPLTSAHFLTSLCAAGMASGAPTWRPTT